MNGTVTHSVYVGPHGPGGPTMFCKLVKVVTSRMMTVLIALFLSLKHAMYVEQVQLVVKETHFHLTLSNRTINFVTLRTSR